MMWRLGAAGDLRKAVYRERVALPQMERAVDVGGWQVGSV